MANDKMCLAPGSCQHEDDGVSCEECSCYGTVHQIENKSLVEESESVRLLRKIEKKVGGKIVHVHLRKS